MYYLSHKLRKEFKVLGEQLDEITKEFGGLKRVRWLASRFTAISMLANNHKVLCFHLQNVWNYGDTAKCCKSIRFSSKNSNPKIYGLPTFLRGFASDFTKNVITISNWQLVCIFRPAQYSRKYCLSWRVAGGARREFPQIVKSSYYQWRWCDNI